MSFARWLSVGLLLFYFYSPYFDSWPHNFGEGFRGFSLQWRKNILEQIDPISSQENVNVHT
jgi:hypothetical protein